MLSETTRKGEITRDMSIDTERCKGENQALGPQHVEIVQEGRIRQQETEKEQPEEQRKTGGMGRTGREQFHQLMEERGLRSK